MKLNIYTIYDCKAKVYNKPFYLLNHDVALRSFTELANDITTDIGKHPEDFTLFHLGEFDDNESIFNLNKTPNSIAKANTLQTNIYPLPATLKEQAQ